MTKVCSFIDCDKPNNRIVRGLCKYHYNQLPERKLVNNARTKRWRLANPEKAKQNDIAKRKKNPELYNAIYAEKNRRRRALKKLAIVEKYTTLEVLERDNYTCQICYEAIPSLPVSEYKTNPLYLHVDHVKAIWAGGSDTLNNVRATHKKCNESRTPQQEKEGI